MLAEVLIRSADHPAADGVLDEAIEQAERTGDRYYLPELHRLKGDVARDLGRGPHAALEHYDRALEAARRQGSVLFERRAAVSRGAAPSTTVTTP
jgi:predicted ATPase